MRLQHGLWLAGVCLLTGALVLPQSGCSGQAGKKAGTKQAGKAAKKSGKKRAKKTTEGPAEDTSEKVAEKTTERPAADPAEKPVVKTGDTPVVKAGETPVVNTGETPVVKTGGTPVVKTAEKSADPVAFVLKPPLGLPAVPVPKDNPMTAEKIELGKMLYFDKRLSKDGTVSCATCHDPKMAWAEHTPTSTGIHKQIGGRNAPTVINAAYATAQFWDGRAPSLEAQAVGPVGNPIEMGHSMPDLIKQLHDIPEYQERFRKVFGTAPNEAGLAKAIAAFERTILSGNSPYDKFKAGDKAAMSESAQRGMKLFEDAGCANCHEPPLFSSYDYENAGIGKPENGRMDVTKKEEDKGRFRTPALRDVADTAPYFHDGSAKTLEEAVAAVRAGG
jgi:cytochrome c peroxidase